MAKKAKAKPTKKQASRKPDPAGCYQAITETVQAMAEDMEKFNSGVAAAGRRLRKGAQEIKKQCQQLRKDVQEVINSSK